MPTVAGGFIAGAFHQPRRSRTLLSGPRVLPAAGRDPGELLFVSGTGVGRGYPGDPRKTAETFIPAPLSGEPGSRLYRTGDWGSHQADGVLDFLGRRDGQVKIRGCRIELAEIETALGGPSSCPAVRCCALPCCGSGRTDTLLLLTLNHIISDGWSQGVLARGRPFRG